VAALTEWQGSARGARGTCGAAEQTRRTGGGAARQLVRAALLTRSSAGARAVLRARAVVGSATAGQRGGKGLGCAYERGAARSQQLKEGQRRELARAEKGKGPATAVRKQQSTEVDPGETVRYGEQGEQRPSFLKKPG